MDYGYEEGCYNCSGGGLSRHCRIFPGDCLIIKGPGTSSEAPPRSQKCRYSLKTGLVSVYCVLMLLSSPANADIIFDGSFCDDGFSRYRALEADGILTKGRLMPLGISTRLERVPDPAGSGTSVMRATSLKGDKQTNGGFRSELSALIDPMGSERWYAWSYYLPERWKNIKKEIVIAQIHSIADMGECTARNPPLAFIAGNNKLKVVNAFDSDKITCPLHRKPVVKVDFDRRELISWPLESEKWVSLVLHVKWAADETGFLELWKDGVLIFQEKNHINSFNDERGLWYKTGIYDWSVKPESISIYSTGVKIGDEKETLQSMLLIPKNCSREF